MSRTKFFFAASSIALLLFACSTEGELNMSESAATGEQVSRIIGGSTFSGLPAVGSFVYDGRQHCTGTVIGPRKVLTAAHCLQGFHASRMRFIIGPSMNNPTAVMQVSALQTHPQYNGWALRNDIGIAYLASDAPVEPMGVVRNMDSSWVGTNLFFVGYGVDNGYAQTGAGIKRAVWMAISGVDALTFRYDDPQRNTCQGDSGGPAFYRNENGEYLVAGITSHGDYYCTQYGVNFRVDPYLDFLGIPDEPIHETPVDPCQGETYEGRCDGNTAIWCENEQVQTQNCSESGRICGYAESEGYYACLEPPPQEDPCNGETFEGRCDGNTVIWCENEQVQTQNCSSSGKVCGYASGQGYYACLDAPAEEEPHDPCNGETYEGRCDGNTVIWCENEEIMTLDCSTHSRTCGFSSSQNYYGCLQ